MGDNILVCVKFVPPETAGKPTREGAPRALNPADEAALEVALRLRGRGEVTVLSMGPEGCEHGLRDLLATGADRAVLLCDPCFAGADSYATALTLEAATRRLGPFAVILCGRRAMDGETGQVPPALAARLDWPCVTNAVDLCEDGEGALACERLLEDGVESLVCRRPAVIALCEYSFLLRAPSLRGLRAAKEKQVERLSAAQLGLSAAECGLAGSPTRVESARPHTEGLRRVRLMEADDAAAVLARLIREARI